MQCYGQMTDAEFWDQVEDSLQEPIEEVDSVEVYDFPDAPSSFDAFQMIQNFRMFLLQNGNGVANKPLDRIYIRSIY